MPKTILITGAADGIGLETAKLLSTAGHRMLLHGRSGARLEAAKNAMSGDAEVFVADLSRPTDVASLIDEVIERHSRLDVLINNAGVFKTARPRTNDGLDVRFVVNTFAPYAIANCLLPIIPVDGRIINLSSAAQASVSIDALSGGSQLGDMDAYAQSKLAIAMWSAELADRLPDGPVVVSVNPGSLLASKMVQEGFGVAGNDLGIGAEILVRAALSDEFLTATGRYFDNDSGKFSAPHPDAIDPAKVRSVATAVREISSRLGMM